MSFNDGKGTEFYLDSDGTLFTAGGSGLSDQKVWFDGVGWSEYEPGFNPALLRKLTEDEAREWAESEAKQVAPEEPASEPAGEKPEPGPEAEKPETIWDT